MTPVPLVQLVDANDVKPDGTLDYTAPFDRPYDWTVSGDPRLLARTFGFFATDAGLAEIARYADGIGPWKVYIVSSGRSTSTATARSVTRTATARSTMRTASCCRRPSLIRRAHARGLVVHTWTFRNEPRRLLSDYRGNPVEEYLQFYELGVDGVFSDFPDTAVTARELFPGV